MPPQIRIRVGAAVDANISNAFKPLVRAARDARQAVEEEMEKAWAAVNGVGMQKGGAGGPYRSVVNAATKAADRIVNEEKKKQRLIEQEQKRAARRAESLEKYKARVKDRYLRDQQKQGERDDADKAGRREERIRAIAGGTKENLKRIGAGALGVAGSVARGAGVQTDLAAYVAQAVEVETRATELSSAAYDEKRDKGKRIDPKSLVSLGRQVGQEAAFDPAKVLEGLQAFVGKTGDLATGKAALPGLAKLARATGTSLEDMVGSAGEAAKALGEVGPGKAFETAEAKGKALVDMLRLIAGQGKVGAVELKDLAQYGGRLAAASQAFGGDAAKNLGDMGALAQLSVARGGASSAAEAATAVAGFANTLKTPARAKEFAGHGVKLEAEGGGFRSVRAILKDAAAAAVEKTPSGGSSVLEFKKMFANVKGAQAADPAFQAYSKAFRDNLAVTKDKTKADQAGKAAIDEMFDAFGKAVSAQEESDSFKASMDTSAAKVQQFNNRLGEIGAKVAEKVLPALEKMAPAIVNLAENAAKLIDFGVDNPGKAAGLALAASIGKASIDTIAKEGIERLITGAAGSAKGSQALGALAIVATAITIGTVGKLVIDSVLDSKQKGVEAGIAADAAAQNALSAVRGAERTGDQKQAEAALVKAKEQQAALDQRITAAQDPTSFFGALFGSKTFGQREQEQQDAANIEQIKADRDALKAAVDKLTAKLGGTLNVNVNNMPATPGPTANTAATTK